MRGRKQRQAQQRRVIADLSADEVFAGIGDELDSMQNGAARIAVSLEKLDYHYARLVADIVEEVLETLEQWYMMAKEERR
jgi:hypothetical protein